MMRSIVKTSTAILCLLIIYSAPSISLAIKFPSVNNESSTLSDTNTVRELRSAVINEYEKAISAHIKAILASKKNTYTAEELNSIIQKDREQTLSSIQATSDITLFPQILNPGIDSVDALLEAKTTITVDNTVYKTAITDLVNNFVPEIPPSTPELSPVQKLGLNVAPTENPKDKTIAPASFYTAALPKIQRNYRTNPSMIFTGTAIPNSYITLFIYSTEITATIKTDAKGNWQYEYKKLLENGEHTLYVTTLDNNGKIIAMSEPYVFTKSAQSISTQNVDLKKQPDSSFIQFIINIYSLLFKKTT